MQIMPTNAAWTNPAALNQQALGDSKRPGAIQNAGASAESVTPLEQTEKTSDRDANERYEGPQSSIKKTTSNQDDPDPKVESMLSLPANDDDSETTNLDLLG